MVDALGRPPKTGNLREKGGTIHDIITVQHALHA